MNLNTNSSYEYSVFSGSYINPDYGEYTGYGLRLEGEGVNLNAPDIFMYELDARKTAREFTRLHLHPLHFMDVVEDILS